MHRVIAVGDVHKLHKVVLAFIVPPPHITPPLWAWVRFFQPQSLPPQLHEILSLFEIIEIELIYIE